MLEVGEREEVDPGEEDRVREAEVVVVASEVVVESAVENFLIRKVTSRQEAEAEGVAVAREEGLRERQRVRTVWMAEREEAEGEAVEARALVREAAEAREREEVGAAVSEREDTEVAVV